MRYEERLILSFIFVIKHDQAYRKEFMQKLKNWLNKFKNFLKDNSTVIGKITINILVLLVMTFTVLDILSFFVEVPASYWLIFDIYILLYFMKEIISTNTVLLIKEEKGKE